MTPLDLLAELQRLNVKLTLAGDKLRLEAPAGVLTPALKEVVTKHKPELVSFLQNPTCQVAGQVVRLYHMRPACREIGHCLGLTRETDCELYPVKLGWCRERTK